MLANKYLKYRPEITLEIFTLVWNKLFANGWYNTECDNCDREYDEFSGKYPILKDQENKDFYSEEASEQIKKLTETTVQEILGYNPFEDDFKLERNWQIKTTNEVIEELQKHDILYEVNYSYTPNAYYGMNNGYKFGQIGVKQNVQMITLEQLKQYVLKTTEQPKVMETKVESKPIEKWSVGSYIVFLQDEVLTRSGKVTKGKPYVLTTGGYIPYFTDDNSFTINFNSKKYESYGLQWFATLQEAEMFAKTLVEPVKEEVKQPLKQAVHCKTQEEWDFVTEKLGYKWDIGDSVNNTWSRYGNKTFINLSEKHFNSIEEKRYNYQILSFQEWCDLNGYKMESNQEFKENDWIVYYKVNIHANIDAFKLNDILQVIDGKANGKVPFLGITDIRSSFRHATQAEIQQHLFSTGEILSVDTIAGLDCQGVIGYDAIEHTLKQFPYDVYAASSIGIHQGYFNPNIETPRKINWMVGVKEVQDEVQLELMDIPKI
jgi:hypothetical protein